MKKTTIVAILLATLFLIPGVASGQYPYSGTKTPADTNFRIGKLSNGLTYYIREASNPKGHAEFFIVHNVGSLQENDDQRGLAHFLEHMAFNGTKNFPDKLLLEYFGSIGVKFGANINAYTSMDRTVYNISAVPVKLRSSIIDSALLALHDWSHYISCEPEEIEKERGVVREEWRRGDDSRTRMMKGINRYIQHGSRFAERDVIGLMSVIDNFSRETLIDYYHKWYRPDLQAVIVVGDIDADDIENRIKERFSTIPAVQNGAVRETYSIPENRKPIVGFFTDPESKAVSVRMVVKIPNLTPREMESHLGVYEDVVSAMFLEMIKERVAAAAQDPEAEFRSLVPIFGAVNYAATTFNITALPKDNKNTLGALKGIATVTEGLKQHGFGPEEIEKAKAAVARGIDANYRRTRDPKNEEFVSAAVEHFTRSRPLNDIDAQYKLAKEIAAGITLEDMNRSVGRYLSDHNRVIVFAVPESDKEFLPTEDDVLAMFDSVASSDIEKYVPATDKELEIPVNKAVEAKKFRSVNSATYGIKYEKQLDSAYEWVYPNGTKVIWKEEYGNGNVVRMRAFKNGGYSSDISPLEIKILQNFFATLTINGMNRNEINRWSAANKVSVKPSLGYRTSEFSGTFNAKEAEKFFALLYHHFRGVTIAQSDIDTQKERIMRSLNAGTSQANIFKDSVATLKYSSNPMKGSFDKEFAAALSSQQIMDLYNKVMANSRGYTFVFSGPMDAQKGKELASRFIATLDSKESKKEKFTFKEPVLQTGEVSLRYQASGMLSSKASVNRIYHAPVEYNTKNNLMAKFITYILRERYMKSIREEKGGTYYVGVTSDLLRYPNPTLSFSIDFDTDPALVDDLLEVVQLEVDKLAEQGPHEREMKEITLYLEKVYSENKAKPEWISLITNSILGEESVVSGEKDYLDKMNIKEIHDFARSVFSTGNRMTFVFEPVL